MGEKGRLRGKFKGTQDGLSLLRNINLLTEVSPKQAAEREASTTVRNAVVTGVLLYLCEFGSSLKSCEMWTLVANIHLPCSTICGRLRLETGLDAPISDVRRGIQQIWGHKRLVWRTAEISKGIGHLGWTQLCRSRRA